MRAGRPSREGVTHHRVHVPIQSEPRPARDDDAVNGREPFGQSGSCTSNEEAVGVTVITCALGSINLWFDNGSAGASACGIAAIRPMRPPIFMMSSVARSDAPFVIPCGNRQFSPV
jgi:hypothetical protein